MSDVMKPVEFKALLHWILKEYEQEKTIFGIPQDKFYTKKDEASFSLFGEKCGTAIGPAAGPHTQVAQNIVAAYLTGGRYFELKTVQILDELELEKPCIDAPDEGYNTEWSTELTVPQAYDEYVKGWFLLHLVDKMLGLSQSDERAFIFNMSVGYNLEGIKSPKIDSFIEDLKDASTNEIFLQCKADLKAAIKAGTIPGLADENFVDGISAKISDSITLSTMHGSPPEEQETICRYLIREKKLHTFVKLNPTLLGYEYVRDVFIKLGYDHILLSEDSFSHDMQYPDAVKMLRSLRTFAAEHGVAFGIKLSNTLAVINNKGVLPTDDMYMSGRALYPLTINLAHKLANEFAGELPISYSGGANYFNIDTLLETGIRPITMATELLKPGGYSRMTQLAVLLEEQMQHGLPKVIDLQKLRLVAEDALTNPRYRKDMKPGTPMKIDRKLDLLDCFIAPCMIGCPINQDVPEYIRLIGEERYLDAYELIVSKNPLPFMTGFICEHNCQLKCVRNDYEDAVLIRDLKRIAAERGFDDFVKDLAPQEAKTGVKVAVIGAGPAGLSSAYFLARAGFEVTLFDKTDKPGGMVAHGIPGFRIPDWAIENDIALVQKMGVKFAMNCDPVLDIARLKSDGYKYIHLAIGAWKSRMLKVDGDQDKVIGGIKFLLDFKRDPDSIQLGKNVAVIGGGNSAMDSARAAQRVKGVENVYIIYRRTIKQMPADKEELELALSENIHFNELVNPVAFNNGVLKCQVMKLGDKDSSGRRRPVPVEGKFVEFIIDTVLSAIGELVDYDILKANNIAVDERGNIVSNNYHETSVENVFIGGDAYRGPASIVEAIADAQKVADGIFEKENIQEQRVSAENYKFDTDRIKEIIHKKAVLDFKVVPAIFDTDFVAETQRCLECNLICNKCVEVCPNRANVAIVVANTSQLKDANQILHIDALCNECGNCETFCPYDGAPYKDKFTLFWDEAGFQAITNDGFVFLTDSTIRMRYNANNYDLHFYHGKVTPADASIKVNEEMQGLFAMISAVWERYPYMLKNQVQ